MAQDPDEIIANLKFHLVWNTSHRRSVFTPPKTYFENLFDLFLGFGELVGGMAALMWLAPEQVHIYVESDGEKSIEAIVKKLKSSSSQAIQKKFPDLQPRLGIGDGLWDKAYFLETIG